MTSKKDTFYITTPIYYASGNLHLGHIYTSVAADVLARWNCNIGKEVFFLTGSDEHGQKVAKKANERKVEPQKYVDEIVTGFKKSLKTLNISYDYFIRTTDTKHKKFVQDCLQRAFDKGDIYKDTYKGMYCVDCERYYKEDELLEGNKCPDHKRKVEEVEEENYFFRLSKYQDKLLEFYKKNPEFLSPTSKAQETLNRVKEGLEDISISRSKKTLTWGVELPFDSEHVTYVWFDALFNYISALEINKKTDFWPCNVHIVGKDIMWFHKVYWPAFLLSCGYDLPSKVFAHGWWTVEGEKMGKSMGNQIDPIKISKEFGVDEFRYFLLSAGSFGDDCDYSRDLFIEKINNELNNDLGNLVSRVHAMTGKYFGGSVPEQESVIKVDSEFVQKLNIYKKFNEQMQSLEFNKALDTLWTAIRDTNAYINKVEPWKEKDVGRLASIINILVFAVNTFSEYLDCFMPEKTELIRKQFNFKKGEFKNFEAVNAGHKLGEKVNIFEKVKKEEKKKTGFASLNLKVGKIISVENHPEAEKLYVEKIDVGEENPRQIVSGLKDYYSKEDLKGRKVIIAANLKTAKLRGALSQGMVLLAENKKGELGFLESNAKVGTQLECNGIIANSLETIKIDKFFEVKLESQGDKVVYEGKEIKGVSVEKNVKGEVK